MSAGIAQCFTRRLAERAFSPFNPFQPSVAFHIETSHLFCRAKEMTGYYIKRNTGLKWVNVNGLLNWLPVN